MCCISDFVHGSHHGFSSDKDIHWGPSTWRNPVWALQSGCTYLVLFGYIVLFWDVRPSNYLRRNIPVTNEKLLGPCEDKISENTPMGYKNGNWTYELFSTYVGWIFGLWFGQKYGVCSVKYFDYLELYDCSKWKSVWNG